MSRKQAFTNPVDCARWMLEKPGERWVTDRFGTKRCGTYENGYLDISTNMDNAPFIAIRDEHGDIPDEPGYGPIYEWCKKGWGREASVLLESAIRAEVKAMKQRGGDMSKQMTRDEARVYLATNPWKVVTTVSGARYRMSIAGILQFWKEGTCEWIENHDGSRPLHGLDNEKVTFTAPPDPDELPELPGEIELMISGMPCGSDITNKLKQCFRLLLKECKR